MQSMNTLSNRASTVVVSCRLYCETFAYVTCAHNSISRYLTVGACSMLLDLRAYTYSPACAVALSAADHRGDNYQHAKLSV